MTQTQSVPAREARSSIQRAGTRGPATGQMVLAIASKNLRIKMRTPQTFIFSFGFPIMFTLMFYFAFGTNEIMPGWTIYDTAISGMMIYAASFGTSSAATSLSDEKQHGTLLRLDTTPVGRSRLFVGTLLSEAVFMVIQLGIMVVLAYGVLGLRWHDYDAGRLVAGYLIMLVFGLSTIGVGIIISAYAKSVDAAVGISMMYIMPVIFLSGAMTPFASEVQYFLPPFWANALYRQVVVLGHDFWTGAVQATSTNPFVEEFLPVPLWGAMLIVLAFLVATTALGIKLFQKKTLT
ncbi:MAG: ABC transporter permease [Candidatus Lokiarchaeota archaeon]|nr:ABC transporter permease [Candidatus Lokiarchaeota archaeon]